MMKRVLAVILCSMAAGWVMAEGVTPPPPLKPECHKIVYSKWSDLLFVDNGNQEYVSYQWYKDQVAIAGATRQYLYTEGVTLKDDGHTYYVVATKADGSTVMSCEGAFDSFPRSADYNPGSVRKAVLYTSTGHRVGTWSARPESVNVAAGIYVWQLTDNNGNTWTEKAVY